MGGFERPPMTPEQAEQSALFMSATRGADAWTVAQVLGRMTPGTDWRRCSRSHMARAFAEAKAPRWGIQDGRAAHLRSLSLSKLRAALEKALQAKGRELPAESTS